MLELVQKLNKEKNITVIMVTHKISEALMADRIHILDDSRIVAAGTPKEVLGDVTQLKKYGLEIPVSMKLEAGIPIDVCTEYKRRQKKSQKEFGAPDSQNASQSEYGSSDDLSAYLGKRDSSDDD